MTRRPRRGQCHPQAQAHDPPAQHPRDDQRRALASPAQAPFPAYCRPPPPPLPSSQLLVRLCSRAPHLRPQSRHPARCPHQRRAPHSPCRRPSCQARCPRLRRSLGPQLLNQRLCHCQASNYNPQTLPLRSLLARHQPPLPSLHPQTPAAPPPHPPRRHPPSCPTHCPTLHPLAVPRGSPSPPAPSHQAPPIQAPLPTQPPHHPHSQPPRPPPGLPPLAPPASPQPPRSRPRRSPAPESALQLRPHPAPVPHKSRSPVMLAWALATRTPAVRRATPERPSTRTPGADAGTRCRSRAFCRQAAAAFRSIITGTHAQTRGHDITALTRQVTPPTHLCALPISLALPRSSSPCASFHAGDPSAANRAIVLITTSSSSPELSALLAPPPAAAGPPLPPGACPALTHPATALPGDRRGPGAAPGDPAGAWGTREASAARRHRSTACPRCGVPRSPLLPEGDTKKPCARPAGDVTRKRSPA